MSNREADPRVLETHMATPVCPRHMDSRDPLCPGHLNGNCLSVRSLRQPATAYTAVALRTTANLCGHNVPTVSDEIQQIVINVNGIKHKRNCCHKYLSRPKNISFCREIIAKFCTPIARDFSCNDKWHITAPCFTDNPCANIIYTSLPPIKRTNSKDHCDIIAVS